MAVVGTGNLIGCGGTGVGWLGPAVALGELVLTEALAGGGGIKGAGTAGGGHEVFAAVGGTLFAFLFGSHCKCKVRLFDGLGLGGVTKSDVVCREYTAGDMDLCIQT